MTLYHKARRTELRYSRIAVVTVFWVMLAFALGMSFISIRSMTKIPQRRDMMFITYNLPPLIKSLNSVPDEVKPFVNFNINCMLQQVKMTRDNMELHMLAILFFNLNAFIMLFVAYRKSRKFLFVMAFFFVMSMYFTFTFSQQAVKNLPKRVLGSVVLDEKILERIE